MPTLTNDLMRLSDRAEHENEMVVHAARRSVHTRILRNVLVLGAGQPVSLILASAMTVLLPSYLGDVNLGKLSLAFSFVEFFGLFTSFGITSYLTKEVARTGADARSQVMNALAIRLVLAVAVAVLAILTASLVGYEELTKEIIYLYAVTILFSALGGVFTGALHGMQAMPAITVIGLLSKAALLGFVALFIYLDYGPLGIAFAYTISGAISMVGALYIVTKGRLIGGRLSFREWPSLLRGGIPFFVWEVSLLIYGRIDVVLLSFLSNEAVIGWYGAAYRIISIPAFLPSILIMATFPALSRAASADNAAFISIARRSLQSILFISIPIALGMITLSDKMIDFLRYPEAFLHSAPVVVILALHVPIVGADMVIGTLLNALDKQRAWAITGLAASVINPILNVIFIQLTQSLYDNGALGAALVTVLTELFMMGVGLWLLRGAIFDQSSVRFAAMSLICGLIMTGVVWLVRDQFLPVAVVVGIVIYVLASLSLGTISRRDLYIARSYLIDRALFRWSQSS